jgi:hypothetical protein
MPRQTDFRVQTFNKIEPPALEERLNSLTAGGYTIMAVNVERFEFAGDGSNHGHGGRTFIRGSIVCHRWENEHVG